MFCRLIKCEGRIHYRQASLYKRIKPMNDSTCWMCGFRVFHYLNPNNTLWRIDLFWHRSVFKGSGEHSISLCLTNFDCGSYISTFLKETNSKVQKMCPLRIILVFLSGLVAGYFAWRTFRVKEDEAQDPPQSNSNTEDAASHKYGLLKRAPAVIVSGFWTFVDMASGRYLWQNLVTHSHK